jgi:hypothetical protein
MSNFRVGQRVVCIDHFKYNKLGLKNKPCQPKINEEVTIYKIRQDGYLYLKQYPLNVNGQTQVFNPAKFRPIDELSNTTYDEVMQWIESGKPIAILN